MTFRCPSDIFIMSCWLFTARWSAWPGNHLVPCVAELVGSCIPIHAYRYLPDAKCLFIHLVCHRKFGLRIKEHKKEVDSFTAGTQTWASRARESSVTHKSAITDQAVEDNHVIDWDNAKVVDREAQQQTRWTKEAFWIRKTPICINQDAESYQLSHTWDQVNSRSRAPSSCKQSRRDQDVRRTSKRCH